MGRNTACGIGHVNRSEKWRLAQSNRKLQDTANEIDREIRTLYNKNSQMADKYKHNKNDLDKLFNIYKGKYDKVKNHDSEKLQTMQQDLELKQKGDKYQMMVV